MGASLHRQRVPVCWSHQSLRTLLFAPGNEQRKTGKVGRFGADACVLDLEDAVPSAEKTLARERAVATIEAYRDASVLMVRVNGEETGLLDDDLDAVCHPNVAAVLVPKVETPDVMARVSARLASLERKCSIDEGTVRLIALVETARGVVQCEEIARAAIPRLLTLVFGLVDFALDLNIALSSDPFLQLVYPRSRIVMAARAAGLTAPIDGPYVRLDDPDGCARQAMRSRELGFQGQVVVYPPQVGVIHEAYGTQSLDEVAHARRVVEAFQSAQETGRAAIRFDGEFIDYPVYHRACRVLELDGRQ